jgi:hypothetical protein
MHRHLNDKTVIEEEGELPRFPSCAIFGRYSQAHQRTKYVRNIEELRHVVKGSEKAMQSRDFGFREALWGLDRDRERLPLETWVKSYREKRSDQMNRHGMRKVLRVIHFNEAIVLRIADGTNAESPSVHKSETLVSGRGGARKANAHMRMAAEI